MNDDVPSSSSAPTPQRSLLDRISQFLLGEPKDREELIEVLRESEKRGLLDADVLAMIEGALQVSDMRARDVMIPRSQMVVVERDATKADILKTIITSSHSRFPVIGEDRDEVLGILLAKDLLPYVSEPDSMLNVRDMLRPAVFIPESKRLDVLLRDFRASRNHLALVVDEFGGVAGMVTIEDVLEQIVGDIEDEHDIDEETFILRHSDTNFTVKALTPVEDFNDYFKTTLDTEAFDTIGGLILGGLGHMPKRGETWVVNRFRFKVVRADNRRIHLLQMTILPPEKAENPAAGSAGGHA